MRRLVGVELHGDFYTGLLRMIRVPLSRFLHLMMIVWHDTLSSSLLKVPGQANLLSYRGRCALLTPERAYERCSFLVPALTQYVQSVYYYRWPTINDQLYVRQPSICWVLSEVLRQRPSSQRR